MIKVNEKNIRQKGCFYVDYAYIHFVLGEKYRKREIERSNEKEIHLSPI